MDEQALTFRSLDDWFYSPQGVRAGTAFSAEFEHIKSHIKGSSVLQLGCCGDFNWLEQINFKYKWLVTPYNDLQKSSLNASFTNLPLERDSVDCILAPLTIDAFESCKSPIDEMDRVLKPMGYIVFWGISPFSLWGLSLRSGFLSCFGRKRKSPVSAFWLKRNMHHRGYQQCFNHSFFYIPPLNSSRWIKKLEFLNEMGKLIQPFPAGFYCLVVQKYQFAQPFVLTDPIEEQRIIRNSRVPQVTQFSKLKKNNRLSLERFED